MPEFITGRKPVAEALETGQPIDLLLVRKGETQALREIVHRAGELGIACRHVSRNELDKCCPGNNQGIAARLTRSRIVGLEELVRKARGTPIPLLLALDQVQDPGNAGTLARTLLALGGSGIILPKNNSAHLGSGAYKASAGAISRLPLSRVTNMARTLDELKKKGFWIYGAGSKQGEDVFEFGPVFPAVLVLGNEEKGIRPNVFKRCDVNLRIPMPGGFESLNVAQAGAIILAQFMRRAGIK